MTELDYILQTFDKHFRSLKGSRIALYSGEYLGEILRNFDNEYHFYRILEPECTDVPAGADLVVLTDRRTGKEPDYNRIRRSCEERNVPVLDLFGLDQAEMHRELNAQGFLSLSQWKALLSGYDVITILISGAVARYFELQDRWALRSRFRIMFDWMQSMDKTVLFLWDKKEQADLLKSEIPGISEFLIERKGNDQGFLHLALRYKGKKIIHIGIGTVRDGIIPREYGIDSRLFRYAFNEVTITEKGFWTCVDRNLLQEEIDRHSVISFDIYDTLLKRTVLCPKDVFEIVEERTGIRGFADCRYEIQTSFSQFSLKDIYDCLKDRSGFDDRTLDLLLRTELQVESDVTMPRRSMVELFDYAKDLGKTIVLVSDMYLDPSFIRELLKKNGITGFSNLYVSCQFKKLKQEGLYEELLRDGKPGNTILHIGDDYYSDFLSARDFGLDAFYVPACLSLAIRNGYKESLDMCQTLADRKMLGLSIAMGFDNPFVQDRNTLIANMIAAPLAIGYLQWVCNELIGKEYDRFLLSSRDGYILLDAYNKLRQIIHARLPEGRYFYTSRHAAFLTVMDDPDAVDRFLDISAYDDDPPRLLRQIFSVPDEMLLPWHGEPAEEYVRMHESPIRAAAERFRYNYQNYLALEGIAGKKCAVMDFVSEGSSQMMLERYVSEAMDGYYVGIPEYASKTAGFIRYYLDHDMMDYDTEMKIEVYYTSMEPSLDHIGDYGRPVLAEENRTQSFLARIETVHALIRHYMDRYLDRLYDPRDMFDKAFIFELCKTVNAYDVENCYYDDMSGRIIEAGS